MKARFWENKYFSLAAILFILGTTMLLLFEVFAYPGVVQKYTHISIMVYMFVSVILVVLRRNLYSLTIQRVVLYTTIFLLAVTVFLSIQESIHFENFVFSRFHISLISLQYLLLFFVVQIFIDRSPKRNICK
jgi:hypothetical protein